MSRVFDFTHAIVRRPGRSVVAGLRAGGGPDPGYDAVTAEHAAYVAALKESGLIVEALPPLEDFPDSVFVEDPAFVLDNTAILLRPGAPSRLGEPATLRDVLNHHFVDVVCLEEGFADGGDILITPREILIGLSARTNRAGAEALARLLGDRGLRARIVETPPDVLHLKTACALLDEDTVFAAPALAPSGAFEGLKLVETPAGEEAAANLLRINDRILVCDRFPRTLDLLAARRERIVPLPTDEIGKLDAGLSCLSLRWSNVRAS